MKSVGQRYVGRNGHLGYSHVCVHLAVCESIEHALASHGRVDTLSHLLQQFCWRWGWYGWVELGKRGGGRGSVLSHGMMS